MAESAPIESAAPGGDAARYRLHGVERALDTLELLAAAGPGGMTLTELADRISVSKSSAFALLQTLIARGFATSPFASRQSTVPPSPSRQSTVPPSPSRPPAAGSDRG